MSNDIAAGTRYIRHQSGDRPTHAAPDLLSALTDGLPDWMDDAACKGQPSELFFPEKGGHPDRSFCQRCPVQQECLDYANGFEGEHRAGLWGGTTPRQRKKLSRKTFNQGQAA